MTVRTFVERLVAIRAEGKGELVMTHGEAEALYEDAKCEADRMFGRVHGRRLRQRLAQLVNHGQSRFGDDRLRVQG